MTKTRSVMTACDSALEDLLPWWVRNTKRFTTASIVVVDLGMTDLSVQLLRGQGVNVIKLHALENMHTWFNKPWCLEKSETDQTLWLDLDVEVLKDIDDIWDLCQEGKMGLCPDPVMIRQGEKHSGTLNTGVILFESLAPETLEHWKNEIKHGKHRGDQEALRHLRATQDCPELFELPQEWNWLRLMYMRGEVRDDIKMLHWTGPTGKQILREKIIPRFFDQIGKKGNKTIGHYWSPEGHERETDNSDYKKREGLE